MTDTELFLLKLDIKAFEERLQDNNYYFNIKKEYRDYLRNQIKLYKLTKEIIVSCQIGYSK